MPTSRWASSLPVRGGFTVVELVLVLGVITMLTAMVWPSIARMQDAKALNEQAEKVRVALLKSGRYAMEHAEAYIFKFEDGGRKYGYQPESGLETDTLVDEQLRQVESFETELPQGFRFEIPVTFSQYTNEQESFNLDGVDTRTMVRFSPLDGSADNREIMIRDPDGNTVIVSVRGLTGGVRISRMNPRRAK